MAMRRLLVLFGLLSGMGMGCGAKLESDLTSTGSESDGPDTPVERDEDADTDNSYESADWFTDYAFPSETIGGAAHYQRFTLSW